MYNMTENETKLDLIYIACFLLNKVLAGTGFWRMCGYGLDNSSTKLLLFPKNEENRQKMGDRIDSKIVVRGLRFMGTL